MKQYKLDITGMSCASCSARIEKVLNRLDSVEEAVVNLANEKATVRLKDNRLSLDDIIAKIEKVGFGASESRDDIPLKTPNTFNLETLLLVLCLGLSSILVAPMVLNLIDLDIMVAPFTQLLLATPIQIVVIYKFFPSAFKALRNLNGNMDLLVSLGTTSAFGLSLYLLYTQGNDVKGLYFEASASVTSLVMLGKMLERNAKNGANDAIQSLINLRPTTARIIVDDKENITEIKEVKIDDIVLVKPGEYIPVDGVVISGTSNVNEAMLSGESLPVLKKSDHNVHAATLNIEGQLLIKTTKTEENTYLASIIQMIEDAQTSKAPIQRLVDKISSIFVPVICLISLITAIGWLLYGVPLETALINAITVLVIACPCALGLATPTAIIVGTGVAAKHGILIKDAQSLEIAHRVDHVVFDKTGTLTKGTPEIAFMSDEENLKYGASLQYYSEHPLASAFKDKCEIEPVSNFRSHTGLGIEGKIRDRHYRLGSQNFMTHSTNFYEETALKEQAKGRSVIWLEDENEILGIFALEDQLKENSIKAIESLKKLSISSIILSGDTYKTVSYMAFKLGIDEFQAPLAPNQKAGYIEKAQHNGQCVAMVGDGINDAPALAQADISFAMSSGSDTAIHSAGITLMQSDPLLVPHALDVARKTYRKIQQNLFWAFIYNVFAIPAAAFGLLNPVIAGGAMAFSSVSVVMNSLLLKRWKP